MLHRAVSALVAVHYALYVSALVWLGLTILLCNLSNYSLGMSIAYAGEIVGGYWIVQGTWAVVEKLQKARRDNSRNRSLD